MDDFEQEGAAEPIQDVAPEQTSGDFQGDFQGFGARVSCADSDPARSALRGHDIECITLISGLSFIFRSHIAA